MSKLSDKFTAGKLSIAEKDTEEKKVSSHSTPSRSSGPLHGSVTTMKIDFLKNEVEKLRAASPVMKINPSEIRFSKWANRHDDSFKSTEFDNFKKEILSAGGNIQAIKIRPIQDDAYKYEIVFGHRRHQACLEIGIDVTAIIDTSIDEKCMFIEMDRENRQRSDLRPYEQGVMYKKAIDEGLFPSLRKLSESLSIPLSNVACAIAIVNLPAVVLDAFPSRLDIQYRWPGLLNDALNKHGNLVITKAESIISERKNGAVISASETLNKLIHTNGIKLSAEPVTVEKDGMKFAVIKKTKGIVSIFFEKNKLSDSNFESLLTFIRTNLSKTD